MIPDQDPPSTGGRHRQRASRQWMTADTDEIPAVSAARGSGRSARSDRDSRRPPSRALRRVKNAGRVAVVLATVSVLASTGAGWEYLRAVGAGFTHVDALDPNSTDVVDPGGQQGDENFLIVGTDSRAGTNGQLGAGDAADIEGARSDTVILISIPADRQRVVAVSFPRDLDVSRPACQSWNNAASSYSADIVPAADGDKLNATYAIGGPRCLVKVIQKISGIKIGHFIGIDFAGFQAMVDQVDGVRVCTATPLIDDVLGPVLPTAGPQIVNGETALNYVRARHVHGDGTSDYGRIKRQQLFLSSLLRSAMSTKVLLDPGKLNGFISALTKETFVEAVTPQDLLTLSRSLQSMAAGAITFLTVPTSGTNDRGNEIPRTTDIKAIFRAIIDDTPLPGERRAPTAPAPAPPAPAATVDPAQVRVRVYNATTTPGLASTSANTLAADGFQIYGIGNSPGNADHTVIRYAPQQKAAAQTLAAAIPEASSQEFDDSDGTAIDLVLGADFSGLIQTPTASGGAAAKPLPSDLTITNAADDTCA